ncbi:SHOCT domain-containing protein [Streptomyces netropsis]|uniref:SHOCT domain-containing protein n=1 Tax=Streptomyces netropsis TaxID=55404 RepID=A0A7W7PIF0_STRNE|nr:SHOCT domain-containing protein [Streptomyces netropsis]MBB4889715.1 hypothetical protein [Streptomyces netropsis]
MVRYEGIGGWIEVEEASLTMCRTDGGSANIGPRTLPLRALSGVAVKEATRLRRGHIQLWFGACALVPVGSDEDPNMIGFGHGQRETFRSLHEYLAAVVRTNEAQDVDVAAAYAAARDPLAAWVAGREQAFEQAESARSEQQREAERQRIETLARKIGPEAASRPDIMAAGLASATGDRSWYVLQSLPALLLGGEQVFVVAECFSGNDLGTLVLTNQRLVLVRSKLSGHQVEVLRLGEIRAVSADSKITKGVLRVDTVRGVIEFHGIRIEDLKRLDESLRLAIGHAGRPSVPEAAPPRPGVLDQIAQLAELHAAGVLTTAEFEAKKRQLLDRL